MASYQWSQPFKYHTVEASDFGQKLEQEKSKSFHPKGNLHGVKASTVPDKGCSDFRVYDQEWNFLLQGADGKKQYLHQGTLQHRNMSNVGKTTVLYSTCQYSEKVRGVLERA
ncbi:uncharacterized protein LOC120193267 [Hibiscus syriacus]|uniref:uncharacterized protein LOC120193267 n=1 Tax=Hibiscus syriacus TaxID=106335 RepID=UPI001921DF26|nr:uncharacterized protein LOC120193267 [Hibiscus syriacus]